MPRIPTVRNQAGFAPLNLPRPRRFDIGGGAFRALEGFGENLGRIADRLQDSQDDHEFEKAGRTYNAEADAVLLGLKQDPNYLDHPATGLKQLKDAQKRITGSTQNPRVKERLNRFYETTEPGLLFKINSQALGIGVVQQKASLFQIREELVDEAAKAETEEEIKEKAAEYSALVEKDAERGILNALEAQKEKAGFLNRVDQVRDELRKEARIEENQRIKREKEEAVEARNQSNTEFYRKLQDNN